MPNIPAIESGKSSLQSRAQKWPARSEGDNRIEPICRPEFQPRFTFADKISVFTIGSCFARNIEEYLRRLGMTVPTMDFEAPSSEMPVAERQTALLNKYTPHSVQYELQFALDPANAMPMDDHFIEMGDGKVLDLHLPSYTGVDIGRARARREEIRRLFARVRECNLVIITLGLIESWFDQETRRFIAQVPPPRLLAKNAARFKFRRLSYEEAREATFSAIDLVLSLDADKKIIVTTSPVPLARTFTDQDVILANTYSKSLLRVLSEEVRSSRERVDYFPSYEIVSMTDRSLAWGNDQRHVKDSLVGEIVGRVCSLYFPASPTASDAGSRHAESRMLLSNGLPETAFDILTSLEPKLGNDAHFLGDLHLAATRTKRWSIAADIARRLIALNGETARRQLMLGEALFMTGNNWDHARRSLTRSIEMEDTPRARLFLARTLVQLGQPEEALLHVDGGIRAAGGDFPRPWIKRGLDQVRYQIRQKSLRSQASMDVGPAEAT